MRISVALTTAPPSGVAAETPRPAGERSFARNLAELLGSHAVVAAVGIASLPLLARNLGVAAYGQFSLFLTALGVLSNLDLARPILVQELAQSRQTAGREERALAVTSAVALGLAAGLIGALLGGPLWAAALGTAALLHGATAVGFAQLSAQGRVGLAGRIRNTAWALALVAAVGASFFVATVNAYAWAFVGANLFILWRYQSAVRQPLSSLLIAPKARLLLERRDRAADIAVFAGASAVVSSADKLILERCTDRESFGHYAGQYDLAVKVNIVSTALGNIILPKIASLVGNAGKGAAERYFVRVASWVTLGYFVALAAAILLHAPIMALVLGQGFVAPGTPLLYPLFLLGVFIHLFGFLITAYQRALGDFRTHRVTYIASAATMLLVGSFAIPAYGPSGALATYLTARCAELGLIAIEARRLTRGALPPWRLIALLMLAATLGALATSAVLGS